MALRLGDNGSVYKVFPQSFVEQLPGDAFNKQEKLSLS